MTQPQPREPHRPAMPDETEQREWWLFLGEAERRFWLVAAQTDDPALAWAYFKERRQSFAHGSP